MIENKTLLEELLTRPKTGYPNLDRIYDRLRGIPGWARELIGKLMIDVELLKKEGVGLRRQCDSLRGTIQTMADNHVEEKARLEQERDAAQARVAKLTAALEEIAWIEVDDKNDWINRPELYNVVIMSRVALSAPKREEREA
ncbi:hypothetical protein [Acetonema longum]|uniref:Uncharacterized protein n=1 Tax=Acetonema longum DSM 6540 TaxID=1009370 RepID=F7NKB5_9FIRM|nr:hypothetical protein [Acetonema longum]EGO63556.1 hypothetical protein ALO_12641 [Acetonema longum DSM 6540]